MSGYRQDGGLRTKGLFLKTSLSAKPLVSVVTPVYNAEDTIAETINSIISQSYENIEYIIIDGGSNDGTLEIIKAFEDRIAYWLSEKDGGMYEAVNKGFRAARGEIVSYLNADDIYNPGAVAIAVGHFLKYDSTFIHSDCEMIDAAGRPIYRQRCFFFNPATYISWSFSNICQQTAFWRKAVHEKIGYFNEDFKYAGDFEFFARVSRNFRVDGLKVCLAKYRMHVDAISFVHKKEMQAEVSRIHKFYGVKDGLKIREEGSYGRVALLFFIY